MKPANIRFPHSCRIYRKVGVTNFSHGTERELYRGVCRKGGSTNLRTFKTNDVVRSDYSLSIPGMVTGINAGDMVDVADRQGMYLQCLVVDAYACSLGTTVYFNHSKA